MKSLPPEIIDIILHPDTILLDVHESLELFKDGKIDRAIHIPVASVPHRVEEIKAMKKSIVVFCRSGRRSEKVLEYLAEQGVEEIYNGGGYENVNAVLGHPI